ncbi:MAG TPA: hypothetical protein VM938_04345 [Acidimicrobiales bacterium]|nr:hypothetical protein [Acidimicrobiales bacterium]
MTTRTAASFRAMPERLSEPTAEREKKLAMLGALLDQLGRGTTTSRWCWTTPSPGWTT